MLYDLLIAPFVGDPLMQQALAACVAISLGSAPIGVFLMLRRLSLMGDALSHAILPGVGVAYLGYGMAPWALMLGGLGAGLLVALSSMLVSRTTRLKEESSFAALYLLSLAVGVVMLAAQGDSHELMHILFGDIFSMDRAMLLTLAGCVTLTLLLLAAIYRPLVMECFEPAFLRQMRGRGGLVHGVFIVLVVLNLVAAFQALGTLMTLGLMLVPAVASNFWSRTVDGAIGVSVLFSLVSGVAGLIGSYHLEVPSGAAMVLAAGVIYAISLIFGPYLSLRAAFMRHRHLAA